jgi:hypothetical protein
MSNDEDTTKSEAWEGLVGLGATLMAVEPVTGAAMMLAGKMPSLWARRASARATAWWKAFLDECRTDPSTDVGALRARIEQQMESSPEMADVIMSHMRQVLDAVTGEAVPVLGALHGAYHAKNWKPDGFFRGATELLMQCAEADLEALRALAGRIACITPVTKTKTVSLSSRVFGSRPSRFYRVSHIEQAEHPNAALEEIMNVEWDAGPLWQTRGRRSKRARSLMRGGRAV